MAAPPPIYLDHHATTPLDPRVLDAMLPYLGEDFGNAASKTHVYGWRAEAAVEDARERLAAVVGAEPSEIVFTSGATEANNLAILGIARARAARGDHIVTVATEHPSVLDPVAALVRQGFRATVLGVDDRGFVDPEALRGAIDESTLLVSVGMANGEVGVIQPLNEIAAICGETGTPLHTDAAQALGKLPVHVGDLPVDLLSFSGHKIYGPKGVGALFVRARRPALRLEPLLYGGGHEGGLRSGTLPVPLIVGMARALELCVAELEPETKRLTDLRDHLLAALREGFPELVLNGDPDRRLPGNLNVCFPGVDAERLLLAVGEVAFSTGSACSSASPEPSPVLRALGLPVELAKASVRLGLGRGTTREEVERAASRIVEALPGARRHGVEPG